MLNNITIGTYLPYNSIIHKINPLAKIISLILLLVGVFLIKDLKLYLVAIVLVFILVKVAKLSILRLMKSLKILMFMFIFLFIINLFIIKRGDLLYNFFGLEIYSGALYQTLLIFFRLMLMVFLSSILTMTTKPLDLTLGIEQSLTPLKKIGFPAHAVAMMISIALRFIPILVDETNKIMIAQTSRGVDFQASKIKEKIQAVISLLIPLFVSAFKRAEDLANAMEARGYNPNATRTRYVVFRWQLKDTLTIIVSVLFLGGIICYSIIS
ncbi:MAG: energy-coupling factor transporter transmembrane component T [Erysipelotrichales bacterium]